MLASLQGHHPLGYQFGPLFSSGSAPALSGLHVPSMLLMQLDLCYLPSRGLWRIPTSWPGIGNVACQLWASSPHMEHAQRREKERWKFRMFMPVPPPGTHSTLCSCTHPGPGLPPECLLEVPTVVFHRSVRPGGDGVSTRGSVLLSSGWLSQQQCHICSVCHWLGRHSILPSYPGVGQSFQGAGKNWGPSRP